MKAGGVAVATPPPSLSTDLGDDNTAGGRMATSPTVSRSDASGCQPARSGRSIDSHSLQRRQAAIGAALHRLGSDQGLGSPSGDASSGGKPIRPRAKRARSDVTLEKVWGWLEGGTLGNLTPAAAAMPAPMLPPDHPAEMCSRHSSLPEMLLPVTGADTAAAAAPAVGGLADALAHNAQPSRPLKRKSASMAPPAPATLPPPPNPGAPEVDLECMLARSNLERSRVARLNDAALAEHDAALAQHDAALLAGLEGPQHASAATQPAPGNAAAGESSQPSVNRWAAPSAAVAIPSAASAQPFGSVDPASGPFSLSIGAAPPAAEVPRFRSGSGLSAAAAAAAVTAYDSGIAGSAPPKLSPVAAAAASLGSQRRRRSMGQS